MYKLSALRQPVLMGLVVLSLGSVNVVSAAVPDSFFVEISVGGSQPLKPHSRSRDPYQYHMSMYYNESDTDDTLGGGTAGFGVFDSGEVVLTHYAEYVPSFAEAYYDRGIYTDKRGFGLADTPRYIMVCAWSDQDEENATRMFRSYAERDDAFVQTRNRPGDHSSFLVRYRPVPTRRAKEKFVAQDYCAEVAEKGQASVPYWLPPKRGK